MAELRLGQPALDKLGERYDLVSLSAQSRDEYKRQCADGLYDGCEAILYSVTSRGQIGALCVRFA